MDQERSKQIAPQVVLAQHGNKEAMRDIYLQYHKNIFFICKILTGNASATMDLTVQIFTKMFESVDKLDDHMSFEPWFCSLAINLCKAHMQQGSAEKTIVTDNMKTIAKNASAAAKAGDRYSFERSVMKLFEEMLSALPNEAKTIFFYRNAAGLDAEKIALLEKEDVETVEKGINAVDILFDKQIASLKELGVDMTPFVRDTQSTISHLTVKTFVPDSVHARVSEKTGVNMAPYAEKKEHEEPAAEKKQPAEPEDKGKKKKKEKKGFLSRSDLILFLVVIVVSVLIFSGVKIYRSAKNEETPTTAGRQEVETVVKPVLAWNGAAASSFASGKGTQDAPYVITSGGELAYLANLINSGNSQYAELYYELGCDIVLNDPAEYNLIDSLFTPPENRWTPIGGTEDAVSFSGSFDGKGYSISGMYVSGEYKYSGLFGEVANGCIKNLIVKDSFVSSTDNCGGIVGYIHGDKLVGADVRNCAFSGTVISSGDNAGGIAGNIEAHGEENFMTIEQCYSLGAVIAGGDNAGGIAGIVYANSGDVKIAECFSVAEVSSEKENAGGIAGCCKVNSGDGSVYNCYYSGKASGANDESVGAITGMLKCENSDGVINVMYCVALDGSAQTLTGVTSADSLSIKDVKTASSAEMKSENTFETYDFDAVWDLEADCLYEYPVLLNVEFIDVADVETATGQ